MYNLPEMAARNAAFWEALSKEVQGPKLATFPSNLVFSRPVVPDAIGPEILFTQTCGYPLRTIYSGQFAFLGVPTYDFPGCGPSTHRAFVIVGKESPYRAIEDLRGARFALNSIHSNSGMNLPRILLARHGIKAPFFGAVVVTRSHTESIRQVQAGHFDAASIDCVTYGFFKELCPEKVSGIRVLAETPESPAIPFVTSIATPSDQAEKLRSALFRLVNDPIYRPVLGGLHIKTITAVDPVDYERVIAYEREAAERGYAELK
ncbi:PhnD/SsuA/transferrin family substrate-binding protein [Bradyrhizobium commune]|uniref:PhnD/SsuA/transferrin family substrate-binding protein n=2 Tax=Bradyrhizobium commune TaxID=83627 RepID=A0A7S9H3R1_9BRAD|nr:PhnD/SsuA/transferrin family substrate-binding protein [Bradyrhizobium commune]